MIRENTLLAQPFEALLGGLMTRQFDQGSILVYQGEVPQNAYILKSGIVKLYHITAQGDERIAAFKLPGEMFPTAWSFDKAPGAFYYYEAQTDGEYYVVPRSEFRAYIIQHPEAMRVVADHYLRSYAGALMRITALEQPKAFDKVLYTLYYLIQCYGEDLGNGIIRIPIQLTQQLVANLIGLTRETTAAELVKLKKRSILRYKGREYTIDREKLIHVIGEDNFKGLEV